MNTQINIDKNGTTTLATAGKYCDRNIDVNVAVPNYEEEVNRQKAITDSILDRTITDYFNDSVTVLYTGAFRYASLERAEFTQPIELWNTSFSDCASLVKFILRSEMVCTLKSVGAFIRTPIESGTGYIYVPDSLVDTYKTTTNWSTYAAQIKPISELEG